MTHVAPNCRIVRSSRCHLIFREALNNAAHQRSVTCEKYGNDFRPRGRIIEHWCDGKAELLGRGGAYAHDGELPSWLDEGVMDCFYQHTVIGA